MKKYRMIIASEIDEVIKVFDPLIGKLSDEQKKELENLKKCKLILTDKIQD